MSSVIPYGRQYIDSEDIRAVSRALKQEKLTTGPLVEKFEKKISSFTDAKYTIA